MKPAFAVALGVGVAVSAALVGHASALSAATDEAGIKQQICNRVGCPDTSTRLCAEVTGEVNFPFFTGSVDYKCYEPEA